MPVPRKLIADANISLRITEPCVNNKHISLDALACLLQNKFNFSGLNFVSLSKAASTIGNIDQDVARGNNTGIFRLHHHFNKVVDKTKVGKKTFLFFERTLQ